jgi:uncharacterized spore protein YtfJ
MTFNEFIARAQDSVTVRKVYGDPIEKDGITVIPAAREMGGGGGGTGGGEQGQQGEGGGWGMNAKPAGAFIIRDGQITWRPAVDANTLIVAVAAVLVAGLLGRALRRSGH